MCACVHECVFGSGHGRIYEKAAICNARPKISGDFEAGEFRKNYTLNFTYSLDNIFPFAKCFHIAVFNFF